MKYRRAVIGVPDLLLNFNIHIEPCGSDRLLVHCKETCGGILYPVLYSIFKLPFLVKGINVFFSFIAPSLWSIFLRGLPPLILL